MKKAIIIILTLIILCTGCSNNTNKTTQQSNPSAKLEGQKVGTVPNVKTDTTPSAKMPSSQDTKDASNAVPNKQSSTTSKLNPPKQYVDYIRERDRDNNDDIIFYAKEDIDLDNNDEVIIASGILDKEDPTLAYISQAYLLRDKNGKIEQLEADFANGGYGIYEIKLIRLQNMPKKYIYCGITNGANLVGFKIYELTNNKPAIICYSASATGSGEDVLRDFDNDGQFDGYVQNRASYDVLYYPLCRTYAWKNGDFVLVSTYADIPEYPSDIKEVIIQYIALRVLDDGVSTELEKRLAELCIYDKADALEFPEDVWHEAVYNTLMEFDNNMKLTVKESGDTAEVTAAYAEENNKKYAYTFHLIKSGDRWRINNIK